VAEHLNDGAESKSAVPDSPKSDRVRPSTECNVEELHFEFVTDPLLQSFLLHDVVALNQNLQTLHLTQCGSISHRDLCRLPDRLEHLALMNTAIELESWANLKNLRSLIITKSPNAFAAVDGKAFLQRIIDTLPAQTLRVLSISDNEETSTPAIKRLAECHNLTLRCFKINGRICFYRPFSHIFGRFDSVAFPNLQIISLMFASAEDINLIAVEFGRQIRVLDLYRPYIGDQHQDIFQWLMTDENAVRVCGSMEALEVLIVEAPPQILAKYIVSDRLKALRMRIESTFRGLRVSKKRSTAPSIIFDLAMDLSKMGMWQRENMRRYLLEHQRELELNYGDGI